MVCAAYATTYAAYAITKTICAVAKTACAITYAVYTITYAACAMTYAACGRAKASYGMEIFPAYFNGIGIPSEIALRPRTYRVALVQLSMPCITPPERRHYPPVRHKSKSYAIHKRNNDCIREDIGMQ